MAANPPFHAMEDQTDEDFFDKLVGDDDDFGGGVGGGPSTTAGNNSDAASASADAGAGAAAHGFGDGSDSDEAKAFANLSVEDNDNNYNHSNTNSDSGEVEKVSGVGTGAEGDGDLGAAPWGESVSQLDSANSWGPVESNNHDGVRSEVVAESGAVSNISDGSMKSGVKEVGWSSFHADSLPNGDHGFGSYSDFFSDLGGNSEELSASVAESFNVESKGDAGLDNSVSYEQHQNGTQGYGESRDGNVKGQDLNSSQYWESLYPGWKYDANTGQWSLVDVAANVQSSFDTNTGSEWATAGSDGQTEVNYLQQNSQSVVESTVAETGTTENVSAWNQVSQQNSNSNGYPEHMVFYPEYPGWYYDTIAQDWHKLESHTPALQETTMQAHDHQHDNGVAFGDSYGQNSSSIYDKFRQAGQVDNYNSQGYNSQGQNGSWGETYDSYNHLGHNSWQPETPVPKTDSSSFGGNQQLQNFHNPNVSTNNHVDQQKSLNYLGRIPSTDKLSQGHAESNGFFGTQTFMPHGDFSQQFNQGNVEQNKINYSSNYFDSQKPGVFGEQPFQNHHQFHHASSMGRSSAGRPPHALVTFGFGGKLIVMKDTSSLVMSSFGGQDPVSRSMSVLNLMEVVPVGTDYVSTNGGGSCSYFRALCHQSFPGPLVGGNAGNKELTKWIDERIGNCQSPDMDYRKGEVLQLLLSLLKIAFQHYGKLRSPFGTDNSVRENDAPESAVAKLFASAKTNGSQLIDYGGLSHCVKNLPSEGQLRATASEVQNLLVSGRKREALQCAQEGQLWGPALVLASQLGDQFYVDTVKQMALRQLVAGSPLRTLCLLIAGQPADVFTADTGADGVPIATNIAQHPVEYGGSSMLDDWEENLALITANRTKDDHLVLIHLGDCLWKDRSEITAAHICYLVAEANFESYSDSARLCLIGADHWKHPRTYASPEAIQRTELYEYSKVLGNSQFILLPFQPYKLIYAYMLAEVGRVSDSLKYCQAVLKSLKTGRAPEVETWRQLVSSLEERIKTHQQGGYATNLAPAKLVGKLLNFFDNTAQRVVGGIPPPIPSNTHGTIQSNEQLHQSRVSSSQSTMAMSSLLTSASMEPISEWAADGNKMKVHNRSVSEPDFGRTTPRQVDSSKEGKSPNTQGKTLSSGESRFRFGFGSNLLQKTVGLVLRPRSDKQAKLGEKNKFYYDDKLKRWVEEGAEPPAEQAALPPPPTTAAFQNGTSDYNLRSALKSDGSPTDSSPTFKSPIPSESTSGIPPIPSSSNQFSARGRMGVRARYVDTFNKGGGSSANLFQSPVPSAKPRVATNTKFFVPTAAPSSETEFKPENVQEDAAISENPSTSRTHDSFPPSSAAPMQRYPSMDAITRKGMVLNGNGPVGAHSRRTASWSGNVNDSFSPPNIAEARPLGEALGMPPSSFMPGDPTMTHMPMNGSNFGDDLHEVEL